MIYSDAYVPTRPFVLVLGSGIRRSGDIPSHAEGKGVDVVLVDTKLGGDRHDLTNATIVDALAGLACDSYCLSVYTSAPCGTWCAARRLQPGPPKLRSLLPGADYRMGLPGLSQHWLRKVIQANLVVQGCVSIMHAGVSAGCSAMAECPVERSAVRALDPRHVLPNCEDHCSQFTHEAFVKFTADTGAVVVWGDQCAFEWKPHPLSPLPPQKTSQWMVTPSLAEAAAASLGSLRCKPGHEHSTNALLGADEHGHYKTSRAEMYSPPLCRMTLELLLQGGSPARGPEHSTVPNEPPIAADDGDPCCTEPHGGSTPPPTPVQQPQTPQQAPVVTPQPPRRSVRLQGQLSDPAGNASQRKVTFEKKHHEEKHHDICLYVDDGYATADRDAAAARADMELLNERFKLTSSDNIDLFVGMNMRENADGSVELYSLAYITSLAGKYLAKPLDSYPKWETPASDDLDRSYRKALDAHQRGVKPDPELAKPYASMVGAMIYAIPGVRIQQAQAVAKLARALTFPNEELMVCAVRTLVNMARTADESIRYSPDAPNASQLIVYTDSDWDTLNGTTGTMHLLAGAAIAHNSKKQPCISMSSTEAEIIAASQGALEAVYFRRLLSEMQVPQTGPTPVYVDNQGAIELSKHQKSCHRSRHVLRRYFKVRELQVLGEVEVRYCPTDLNWADFLTKVVTPDKWRACKRATTGHAPHDVPAPPASTAAAASPLAAWAHALGIPSEISSYAEYVSKFGEPCACAACDAAPATSVRRGVGSSFSSAASAFDIRDEPEAAAQAHGVVCSECEEPCTSAAGNFLAAQAASYDPVLDPLHFGLYETGIDDEWCAMPVTTADDNPSFDAAQRGGEKPLWDDAMVDEIQNLRNFGAFKEVPESSVPDWDPRRCCAPSVTETLWVLRRKRGAENEITKYKARCVFNDKRRVNRALIETFSPAVRHTTVKASVAASVLRRRRRFAFDVTGAYLQGEFEAGEVVYARPPKGFRTVHDDGSPVVWLMRVPLYGQGDAGLVWFRTIRKQLKNVQAFNQSDADPSFFWKRS